MVKLCESICIRLLPSIKTIPIATIWTSMKQRTNDRVIGKKSLYCCGWRFGGY